MIREYPVLTQFFGEIQYGFEILKSGRFRLNYPSSFNDPMECFPFYTEANEINDEQKVALLEELMNSNSTLYYWVSRSGLFNSQNEAIRSCQEDAVSFIKNLSNRINHEVPTSYLNEARDAFLVSCFTDIESDRDNGLSKDEAEILMWSHYGNAHRGCCLHFDFNRLDTKDYFIGKVKYGERVPFTLLDFFCPPSQTWMRDYLCTKCRAWEYEQEHRLILMLNQCDFTLDCAFWEIPKSAITGITFGLKSDYREMQRCTNFVRGNEEFDGVKISRKIRSRNSFLLENSEIR